jgi:ADP-L-glycero-D-manno-heptose 6-epimerase
MIIVTGGAGFIGSNLINYLNQQSEQDILLVDNLRNGRKIHNISNLKIADYIDKDDFLTNMNDIFKNREVRAVFHLGACSATSEWDGKYLMKNNYEYTKHIFEHCQINKTLFVYASSASVYGLGERGFSDMSNAYKPINAYAYSKLLFDQYISLNSTKLVSPALGLRFFNVYGQREAHKDTMSSPIHKFYNQLLKSGSCTLFGENDGVKAGEQMRDFVSVDDCVKVCDWILHNIKDSKYSGAYNLGTGSPRSFKSVAEILFDKLKQEIKKPILKFIPFPDKFKGSYQSYTCADLSKLRKLGYQDDFLTLEAGIAKFLDKQSGNTM